MRLLLALMMVALGVSPAMWGQTCTGLCLQQVSCPAGQSTTITGTVYTPNGVDPLPNVLVYIPNAPVDAFTPGVSCPVVGQPPSGSPLVGTMTAVDGTFTLANVPVGNNIPIVIQSGRWRRQVTVNVTAACGNTATTISMPKNQGEGDIPKFAIATGSQDNVECVLRKIGIQDQEFTNAAGTGRINLFSGSGSAGALIDTTTPSQTTLMENASTLNNYDVLMLPCQGKAFTQDATSLANFEAFANAGGRVYSSHFSYVWLDNNPPFNTVANWTNTNGASNTLPDGLATVDQSFAEGQTLAQWLQLTGASTTLGQIAISTLKHDFNGVNAPNQSWLTLNYPALSNPVMQFVFNTPLATAANQCGRVLFNEYHVETRTANTTGVAFPAECNGGAMTPQEKLLEFSLFELTNDGGAATLTPASKDFGSEAVGFTTAPQSFTWTNNSTFPTSVTGVTVTGDFQVSGTNGCTLVAAGGTCQISLTFTPTVLGARTGTLSVSSGSGTATAALTGTGITDLTFSTVSLNFGSLDVGTSATQSVTVTNNASGGVALPLALTTGAFVEKSSCPATLSGNASCTIAVTFTATTTGPLSASLTANTGTASILGLPVMMVGNGVDFTIVPVPATGSVIAGIPTTMDTVTTPIAGFAANVRLSCTTTAPASTCVPSAASFVPASAVSTPVTITTTSKFTVVGYGGLGGPAGGWLGWLWLVGVASGLLLWFGRRSTGRLARVCLLLVLLGAGAASLSGCSGMLPAMNAQYTAPGSYTYTLTATDGILVHSATYTLQVTAK